MTSINPVISKIPVKWGGNEVGQMVYTATKKNEWFTRETIIKEVESIQKDLKQKKFKGIMQVSLLYLNGPKDWRSGRGWFTFDDESIIYKNDYYPDREIEEDPEMYKSFLIYVKKTIK